MAVEKHLPVIIDTLEGGNKHTREVGFFFVGVCVWKHTLQVELNHYFLPSVFGHVFLLLKFIHGICE